MLFLIPFPFSLQSFESNMGVYRREQRSIVFMPFRLSPYSWQRTDRRLPSPSTESPHSPPLRIFLAIHCVFPLLLRLSIHGPTCRWCILTLQYNYANHFCRLRVASSSHLDKAM